MELYRYGFTFLVEMIGLGAVGVLLIILHFYRVTNNSDRAILVMLLTDGIVGCIAIVVFLFTDGWQAVRLVFGLGPGPTNLNLTDQVIPLLFLIDAVGLCILIVLSGGSDRSLFMPLLLALPVLAIILSEGILSEGRTYLPYLPYGYFLFILIAYGITLFLRRNIFNSFQICRLTFYKVMNLSVMVVSILSMIISYAVTH